MRTSARHLFLRCGAIHALILFCAIARAGDVESARRAFADGIKAYQAGDYEGARRLFMRADAEHHAPPIVYNLGLAEERLGRPQAAVDAYERYIAEVGDAGEFAGSAAIAIAQIKARSTKLRIETKPAGAHVFVDGSVLSEVAPATTLVLAGHHVVVVQNEDWRDERTLDVKGYGDTLLVLFEDRRSILPPAPAPTNTERAAPSPMPPSTLPSEPEPRGLVWGAAFGIIPYYMLGVTTPGASNSGSARSILAGPILEIGLALNRRITFQARGLAALGPDGKPSYGYLGGPGLSFRPTHSIWAGATFIGGQIETRAQNTRYGTDLVFGAMFDFQVAVLDTPEGQWLVGFQPGFLLTEQRNDNTAFVFPFSFGFRAY